MIKYLFKKNFKFNEISFIDFYKFLDFGSNELKQTERSSEGMNIDSSVIEINVLINKKIVLVYLRQVLQLLI